MCILDITFNLLKSNIHTKLINSTLFVAAMKSIGELQGEQTAWDTDRLRHVMSLRLPVVKVEDHDGGDNTAGHHEHDAVEIGA